MDMTIEAGQVVMEAVLNDTPTARALFDSLPLEALAHTWGDEIYFEVPVDQELDHTAAELVAAGDLGYWPTGRAFCIFFGPTPISAPGEIRPASAVNIIGRVTGQPATFQAVQAGARVRLSRR